MGTAATRLFPLSTFTSAAALGVTAIKRFAQNTLGGVAGGLGGFYTARAAFNNLAQPRLLNRAFQGLSHNSGSWTHQASRQDEERLLSDDLFNDIYKMSPGFRTDRHHTLTNLSDVYSQRLGNNRTIRKYYDTKGNARLITSQHDDGRERLMYLNADAKGWEHRIEGSLFRRHLMGSAFATRRMSNREATAMETTFGLPPTPPPPSRSGTVNEKLEQTIAELNNAIDDIRQKRSDQSDA